LVISALPMPFSRRGVLKGLAAFLVLSPVRPLLAQTEAVRFLRIATGPTGGTYFPVGSLIASAISNPPGSMACEYGGSCGVPNLIAAAVASQGSVQNLARLAAGSVDLTLCQSDVASAAVAGSSPDQIPAMENLRSIAVLYPEALHIVVRADAQLASLPALRGKRVALGEADSGTFITARSVLASSGVPPKSLKVVHQKLAKSVQSLAEGEIDAFFMVGGFPLSAIAQLAESRPVALIALTDQQIGAIRLQHPTLLPLAIPAGTYAGVAATPTLGPTAQLLTLATAEADLIFAITKALWDPRNRKILDSGHPGGRSIQPATALIGLAAPLHPGAARYYQEAGMKPPLQP
jgi:TRAP transporter TAXI family solute receptor